MTTTEAARLREPVVDYEKGHSAMRPGALLAMEPGSLQPHHRRKLAIRGPITRGCGHSLAHGPGARREQTMTAVIELCASRYRLVFCGLTALSRRDLGEYDATACLLETLRKVVKDSNPKRALVVAHRTDFEDGGAGVRALRAWADAIATLPANTAPKRNLQNDHEQAS